MLKKLVVSATGGKGEVPLAYGENRCQSPAWLEPELENNDPLAIHRYDLISGDPSFISIADGDQIQEVLCLLAEAFRESQGRVPFIAVAGKHGNPCGIGVDKNNPAIAIEKALYGDSIAVMGGEVIVNFAITDELSQVLFAADEAKIGRDKWGLDIIFAAGFSDGAVDLLGKRDKRRLMANIALLSPFLPTGVMQRPVRGGVLVQQRSQFVLSPERIFASSGLSGHYKEDLTDKLIAWAACWRASSNTVALAKDNMLISLGCGQRDRIACVSLCLDLAKRSGHDTKGSQFASDGFFPYATSKEGAVKEGPELLAEAGCYGGVVPADGQNFEQVKQFFANKGMHVSFVAPENRGFSKH